MSRLRANQIVNRDANGPIEATEGLLLSANKHTIYQSGSSVVDVNLNELIKFGTTASAVNEVTITNAAVGGTPTISATGNDTNISLGLTPKGTGTVNVTGTLTARPTAIQDGVIIAGRAGGTSSFAVTIQPTPLTANRTLTLADGNVTLVAGTMATTGATLAQFASTTSSGLASIISDETGSGSLVFATSPTLVTPNIGVATATSVNKVNITAPATSATLTIADGKTLTASNTLTFTGTDSSSVNFGAGGTVLYSTHAEELYELDDLNGVNDIQNTFSLFSNFQAVTITDPFKLLVTIDGILQPTYVHNREYVFLTHVLDSSKYGYTIDHDNRIRFTKSVTWSNKIVMRTVHGVTKATAKSYPFSATDIMFF